MYILRAAQLPQLVGRAFRIPRKPTAVTISDPGHVLAVLWTPHKLDIYSLYAGEGSVESSRHIALVRSINLSWATSTIAFDPANKLLATGNEEGIELIPVTATGPIIRRQLACSLLSSVAFSDDSKSLIATHFARKGEPTTIISVRTEEEGAYADDQDFDLERQDVHQAWIQKINFSQPLPKVKQATFGPRLPEWDDPLSLFAFDPETSRFGIYDLIKKKFTGHKVRGKENDDEPDPYPAGLYHQIIPAMNYDNTHVALIRNQRLGSYGSMTAPEVCVYRFPDSWRYDVFPASLHQEILINPAIRVCLYDRRNEGLDSVTVSRCLWLNSTKLVVLMNSSAHSENSNSDPTQDPVAACGQICVLRLLASEHDSVSSSWPEPVFPSRKTIRLDDQLELEDFPDERLEFEQEVALQRSRTVAQRRQQQSREQQRSSRYGPSSSRASRIDTQLNRSSMMSQRSRRRSSDSGEVIVADEPYSQSQPRSQFSLQRAATVAAASPANRRHLAALPNVPLQYRRADGRGELPHESDADDPRPPPPPYSQYPDQPGPGAVSLALPPTLEVQLTRPRVGPQRTSAGPNVSAPNSSLPFNIPRRTPSRLAVPGSLSTSMTFPAGRRPTQPQSAVAYVPSQSMQSLYEANNNPSTVTLPVMGSDGSYYSAPRTGSRAEDPDSPVEGYRSYSRQTTRDRPWYQRCSVM